jgi:hypothetical protein
MLSVLIPVYNYNVSSLVQNLVKQIKENLLLAEIIIVDDASDLFINENSQLSLLENVNYELLEENIGRSAIRNLLASKASFESYLFIDCDAKIVSKDFLNNYYTFLNQHFNVVCGGLVYQTEVPYKNQILRWYYGKNRECKSFKERMKSPFASFSSFNFLIKKDVFDKVKFNEEIKSYGHEDTLLGIQLKNNHHDVFHIDNPLLHDGLEPATDFIRKTESSIKNLKLLVENKSIATLLKEDITLMKYVFRVEELQLRWLIKVMFFLFRKAILHNLKSTKPFLILFDFYKMGFYFTLK